MSMAAVLAFGRFAASCLPAGWRCERSTIPDASPHRSGADRRPAHWPGAQPNADLILGQGRPCGFASNMQKSLTQMNLQIHHVISEITGVTGLAIVDAILQGERDPAVLAKLRDH